MHYTESTKDQRTLRSWEDIPKEWGFEQLERGRTGGIAHTRVRNSHSASPRAQQTHPVPCFAFLPPLPEPWQG